MPWLLFLSFIAVQIRYLFGDAQLVQVTPGLTYAQYARHGFFELVSVAILVLPLVLAADWLLADTPKRLFRVQAVVLTLMLFVILVSAFHRLRLYQSEFGLTELRLYVGAFICWLAVAFLWLLATVLRGRREHFLAGPVATGFLAVFMLNILNPDAVIVRANLAHAQDGSRFDVKYAATLSADAIPELVAGLDKLDQNTAGILANDLLAHSSLRQLDWRSWNLARAKAHHVLSEHNPRLKQLAATVEHDLNAATDNTGSDQH